MTTCIPNFIAAIPDVDVFLSLEPEELGDLLLLKAVKDSMQNGLFSVGDITHRGLYPSAGNGPYPNEKRKLVELAVCEAVGYLEFGGLIVKDILNRQHYRLSRRGEKVVRVGNVTEYRSSQALPKELLHPLFLNRIWPSFLRGDHDTAVFQAFRDVEVAVRDAGNYGVEDIGVVLMRKAFKPEDGPLTDTDAPIAEREALASLFAGAIGSYKNPQSHRHVGILDASEAAEMIILASHLMRIIDGRVND